MKPFLKTFLFLILSACTSISLDDEKQLGALPSDSRILGYPFVNHTRTDNALFKVSIIRKDKFYDGSFHYTANLRLQGNASVCVPDYLQGGGSISTGDLVLGRNVEGEEFVFSGVSNIGHRSKVIGVMKITSEKAFLQINFRSNFDAAEVSILIPYILCEFDGLIDGEASQWLIEKTDWMQPS